MSRVIEDEDAGYRAEDAWREGRGEWLVYVCACGSEVRLKLSERLRWHQERESPSFHNRFPSCAAEKEGGPKSYQLSSINNGVKGLYYKYMPQIS